MKNLRRVITLLCLSSISSTLAFAGSKNAPIVDRCADKLSPEVLQSEYISTLYVDLKHHGYACEEVGTRSQIVQANNRILKFRTLYKKSIVQAQTDVIAQLGGEAPFYTMYAAVGNQFSLVDIPNPCGRVTEIADLLNAKKLSDSKVVRTYAPYLANMAALYEAKKTGRPLRRLCD